MKKQNMNEINCPNCKEVFKVDETGFAEILKQVRDQQFNEEINSKLSNAVKLTEANLKGSFQTELAEKNKEIYLKGGLISKGIFTLVPSSKKCVKSLPLNFSLC